MLNIFIIKNIFAILFFLLSLLNTQASEGEDALAPTQGRQSLTLMSKVSNSSAEIDINSEKSKAQQVQAKQTAPTFDFEGRQTHLDVTDPKTVEEFGSILNVLTKKHMEEFQRDYGSSLAKAKILTPFLGMVAYSWYSMLESSQSPFFFEAVKAQALIFIGAELADAKSWFIHVVGDHVDVNNKDYPLSLRAFALFMQDHHLRRGEIQKASYWYVSRLYYLIGLPPLTLTCLATMAGFPTIGTLLAIGELIFVQNQIIHAYTHKKRFGSPILHRIMSLFQYTGLIVGPDFHAAHHDDPNHSVNYAIITGRTEKLLSPLLNLFNQKRGGFKGFLERTARNARRIQKFFLESVNISED